ncbi:MAG: hypothetical protein GX800_07120 [Clostridiaceae bacterium]|nr:hypothetical protein [Clostridiaceae bacterium]
MKHRDFIYIGEPAPKIDKTLHKEFLLNVQKAMLLSLEERKLLTKKQAECVFDKVTIKSP